ncbi:MAG: J domain-containing protein [Deltaproteobacteria bacterium]|nr:J domain-containing protein [Deltaproteobacteria bacterium]
MPAGGEGPDRLDQLDYYTLLSLAQLATADQVRQAFHDFALKYHPDRHVGGASPKLARAAQIFRRGAEAYRVLLDPDSRRRYDAQLAKGTLRYDSTIDDSRASLRSMGSGILTVNSPKARPFYKKALEAIKAEDWQTAKLNLKIAQGHEPGNELIESRIAIVSANIEKRKG